MRHLPPPLLLFTRSHISFVLTLCVLAGGLASCSVTKFLDPEKPLYAGSEVEFLNPEAVPDVDELELALLAQVQQTETSNLGMWWWFKLEPKSDSSKGVKRFLQKTLGTEPGYYDPSAAEQTELLMEDYLKDHGYFAAKLDRDTTHPDQAHVAVQYELTARGRARMTRVVWPTDSVEYGDFGEFLDFVAPGTYVKEGEYYSVAALDAERLRVDVLSERRGFFEFTKSNIYYIVDSAYSTDGVGVFMRLDKGNDSLALSKFHIGRTYVFPQFELGQDTLNLVADTTLYEDLSVVRTGEEHIHADVLARRIGLREGDLYDKKIYENTVNQLLDLGVFRFVNYRFERRLTDSTPVLDQYIYLTRGQSQTVSADVEATQQQAANGLGAAINTRYSNNNLLGGAEDFRFSLGYGIGPQSDLVDPEKVVAATEYSARAEIALPRFVGPFARTLERRAFFIPRTLANLQYQLTSRPEFKLQSITTQVGYRYRANALTTHELFPLSASYLSTTNTTTEFDALLDRDERLRQALNNIAILGAEYNYRYTDQSLSGRSAYWVIEGGIRTSGLATSVFATPSDDANQKSQILGVNLAQFIKVRGDIRRTFLLSPTSSFATRLYAGYALPVFDSQVIPFSEQFFAGGPNSIRAFRLRGVGPGRVIPATEDPTRTVTFLNQTGDVRFELNGEYRFDILSPFIEGAAFVDAGNVWKVNTLTSEDKLGEFDPGTFFQELAVGAGLGLRLDVEILIIRADFAVPVRKPWLETSWVSPDLSELQVNIAIGYPF